jgi:hypothetical protein
VLNALDDHALTEIVAAAADLSVLQTLRILQDLKEKGSSSSSARTAGERGADGRHGLRPRPGPDADPHGARPREVAAAPDERPDRDPRRGLRDEQRMVRVTGMTYPYTHEQAEKDGLYVPPIYAGRRLMLVHLAELDG